MRLPDPSGSPDPAEPASYDFTRSVDQGPPPTACGAPANLLLPPRVRRLLESRSLRVSLLSSA